MWSLGCAFIANNTGEPVNTGEPGAGSSAVLACSSQDGGFNWSTDIPICPNPGGVLPDIGQASNGSAPSLAVFNNRLWVAFIANNSGNNILVYSSSNPSNPKSWFPISNPGHSQGDIGQASNGSAPSLASFNKKELWVAFVANNGGNNILVSNLSNGANFSVSNTDIGQASNGSSPSLVEYYNQLYCAFIANDGGNNILVCNSPNGKNWSPVNNPDHSPGDIGQASNGSAPSLVAQSPNGGGDLYCGFLANNSGNNILVCSYNGPGTTWSNNVDTGQASLAAPSLAYFDNFKFIPK